MIAGVAVITAGHPDFGAFRSQLWDSDAWQSPLYMPAELTYSAAYAEPTRFEDASFVVVVDGDPVLGAVLALHCGPGGHEYSGFGRPAYLLARSTADRSERARADKAMRRHVEQLLARQSGAGVVFRDFLSDGTMSSLSTMLLGLGASARPHYTRVIDLRQPIATLWSDVRKSYRSLVNWGRRNLDIQVHEGVTMRRSDLNEFRALHAAAAGRETRSQRTWELQLEAVHAAEAFVVLGRQEGRLVTAGYFPCSANACYYGVSASDRGLFDKPMSHAVLWTAVERARERGCCWFETGEIVYPGASAHGDKMVSIAMFKAGFGGETLVRLDVHLAAGGETRPCATDES